MTVKKHRYQATVTWTGNQGTGTSHYHAYSRDHLIQAPLKAAIKGSSDAAFLGDASRWNPEELLLASASACHKLWYLHLCAEAGVCVLSYVDQVTGTMVEVPSGPGAFTEITLHPEIVISDEATIDLALSLHHKAHELCYIANSFNFPVHCEPIVKA
ncbi:MAG: OsmC family protein [Neisseriaceae bacterium]|nr:OsmC family protein [Neisseriaceae bacterium]